MVKLHISEYLNFHTTAKVRKRIGYKAAYIQGFCPYRAQGGGQRPNTQGVALG